MFSSVESCCTKPANRRLVASSIMLIKYSLGPRPSSQSCSLVSHCTSSPTRLRRGRQVCTLSTRLALARQSLASIIQPRNVSRLTCTWCFLARYSAANVGPNPQYTSWLSTLTALSRVEAEIFDWTAGRGRQERRPCPRALSGCAAYAGLVARSRRFPPPPAFA